MPRHESPNVDAYNKKPDIEHWRPKSFRQQIAESLALKVLGGVAILGIIFEIARSLF